MPLSAGIAEVLGAPPGEANDRIGYLPQRRSFDAAAAGARRRRRPARPGRHRWGVPLPGRRAGGAPRARAERDRVHEVIELVGAQAYAHRPVGQLSGGEQQRLLIAQALAVAPPAAAARRAAGQPRPAEPERDRGAASRSSATATASR